MLERINESKSKNFGAERVKAFFKARAVKVSLTVKRKQGVGKKKTVSHFGHAFNFSSPVSVDYSVFG